MLKLKFKSNYQKLLKLNESQQIHISVIGLKRA